MLLCSDVNLLRILNKKQMKINIHLNPSFLFNSQITYFFSVRNVGQKVKMSFKRQTGIPVHSWLNFEAFNYQLTLRLLERLLPA